MVRVWVLCYLESDDRHDVFGVYDSLDAATEAARTSELGMTSAPSDGQWPGVVWYAEAASEFGRWEMTPVPPMEED